MHTKIVDILEIAVYAPSGENSQPWRFEISKDILYIYNLPKRDNPVYNYRQRGSYIAHGALIQNIKIISPSFGLIPEVVLFPDHENKDLIAQVSFHETVSVKSEWEVVIKQRSTNRKKYKNEKLDIAILEKLEKSIEEVGLCKAFFIEDVESIKKIASCISVPDRIMLEYKPLHDTIFDNIRWTDIENEQKKTGLFVKTMQLAPPEKMVFSMLRHWSVARFAQFVGLPKFIAQENAKKYATSSVYAVCVVGDIDEEFIHAGMAMQKIWLTAITCGLVAHPLAALPYLYENMNNGGMGDLSNKHVELLSHAYRELVHVCKIENSEKIAMILRIGKGDPVGATSPKLKPDVIIRT
jgi:hypothetical protein